MYATKSTASYLRFLSRLNCDALFDTEMGRGTKRPTQHRCSISSLSNAISALSIQRSDAASRLARYNYLHALKEGTGWGPRDEQLFQEYQQLHKEKVEEELAADRARHEAEALAKTARIYVKEPAWDRDEAPHS